MRIPRLVCYCVALVMLDANVCMSSTKKVKIIKKLEIEVKISDVFNTNARMTSIINGEICPNNLSDMPEISYKSAGCESKSTETAELNRANDCQITIDKYRQLRRKYNTKMARCKNIFKNR